MIGVVPPPGMKAGGGGGASAEKLRIDVELKEYVISPLGEIQATWFGCVSRALFPDLATSYVASPSTNLIFVTHSFSPTRF